MDRWRSGTLAFGTARPVSETRRFKPEGEEEQDGEGKGEEKGKEKASLPKICGPTGNTRTLLVTSRWMLRACTGPPESLCISYDTKTSHYFPLSLDRGRAASSFPSSSYSSSPRSARGHVTTIMPILFLWSCDLSPSRSPLHPPPHNLLPSLFTSHLAVEISSASRITYPLNESKKKRRLPAITPPAN